MIAFTLVGVGLIGQTGSRAPRGIRGRDQGPVLRTTRRPHRSRESRGPRRSAGTPSPLDDALADLFPGGASLGVGLELSEPAIKLALELVGYRNRLGYGGNALP